MLYYSLICATVYCTIIEGVDIEFCEYDKEKTFYYLLGVITVVAFFKGSKLLHNEMKNLKRVSLLDCYS